MLLATACAPPVAAPVGTEPADDSTGVVDTGEETAAAAATSSDGGVGGASSGSTGSADGESEDDGGGSDDAVPEPRPPYVDPAPSPGCGAERVPPGEYTGIEIEHGGVTRTYDVYVPEAHDGTTPVPLVFNFHGLTSAPDEQASFSEFNVTAETRGYVVIYGAGIENSWNAGSCCGDAMETMVDDVGFVAALVDAATQGLCVDENRIFATGMSNGAMMSYRLACEMADVFAAIAPVAGGLGVTGCTPSRPVPMLHVHGTVDPLVPIDGGGISGVPSILDTVAAWAEDNGCASGPDVTLQIDDVTCETWSSCESFADVELCLIDGGGHCWPGQASCPAGPSTLTIHASEHIADFFDAHPMQR